MFKSDEISCKGKKRMVRYLIEDVTLNRNEQSILIQIRYKGGTTQSVEINAPKNGFAVWATSPEVVKIIAASAETTIAENIAVLLNEQGYRSGMGELFNPNMVKCILYKNSIPNMKERYLDRGFITSTAKAVSMGISKAGLMRQIRTGKYQGEYIRVNAQSNAMWLTQGCQGSAESTILGTVKQMFILS